MLTRRRGPWLLAALVAVLAFAAGEAFVRARMCDQTGESRFERVRERFLANPLSLRAKRLDPATPLGPEREGDPREFVNAQGYRGPAVGPHKPWGLLRIACLGGSSVYGTTNSSWRATWPARLQQRLALAGPVEVLNGGVPGYQAHQAAERYEQLFAPLAPDAAILCTTYNDVVTSRAQRMGYYAGDVAVGSVEGMWPALLSRSALGLRLLAARAPCGDIWEGAEAAPGHLRPVSAAVLDRESRKLDIERAREVDGRRRGSALDRCFYAQDLQAFGATVERFVAAARRARCTPVLCLEPLAVGPDDDEEAWAARAGPLRQYFPSGAVFDEVYRRYGATLRRVAERHGALFLDAHGELPRGPDTFTDIVHLSDTGARQFAAWLAPRLQQHAVGTLMAP